MSRVTINQDVVQPNLPLEWRVDFEKTTLFSRITRSMTSSNQPTISEITDTLKTLEQAEETKKDVERLLGKQK